MSRKRTHADPDPTALANYPSVPWTISPPTQPRSLHPPPPNVIDLTGDSDAVPPLHPTPTLSFVRRPPTPIAAVLPPRATPPATGSASKPVHTSSPLEVSPICSCGRPETAPDDTVRCANDVCNVKLYHRDCVGLSNKVKYRDTSNWKCRDCRTKPPPPVPLAPRPSTPVQEASETSTAPLYAPEPPLHEEQEKIVAAVAHGYNVFYTGSAGTGKSTVLKAFVKVLQAQGKQVDIIAPSGIAALAIGGSTIYSYAGWHPDIFKEGMKKLEQKAHGKTVHKRLNQTDVLVIDEISMVESDMLNRLDHIMRVARHGWRPERGKGPAQSRHDARYCMGGAQLIVTGDFCQLPPVRPFQYCLDCGGGEMQGRDGESKKCGRCHRVYEDQGKWAFRSPVWQAAEFSYFELRHVHRQSDIKFISILQKVRVGQRLTQPEKDLLLKKKDNMQSAVKLLPQKAEVNRKNQEGLWTLKGIPRIYHCVDKFSWLNKEELALKDKDRPLYPDRPNGPLAALRDHRFEERVEFKAGMLVILLVNLDLTAGLVNGSQGKIVGFKKYDPKIPLVERPPESEPSRSSKHSIDSGANRVNEVYIWKENQCRAFVEQAKDKEFPVVEFRCGITKAIYPSCQMNELGSEKPYSILSRTNIPLAAAWAITIHKSQGMTLDLVSVDLYNSFEKEMVYVALSRARSLEGLEVLRLPRDERQAMNPDVLKFLEDNVWTDGKGERCALGIKRKLDE